MPRIELHTVIHAPVERCYLLSLSIDMHLETMAHTGERVVAGRASGIMREGETVTWRARHFGVTQELTSLLHSLREPNYFVDEMTRGAFKSLYHQHIFTTLPDGSTEMTDLFDFEAPFGALGRVVASFILEPYLRRMLLSRNAHLKQVCESETSWQRFMPSSDVA